MGDVLVESSINHVPTYKKSLPSTIPNVENFEGLPSEGGDDYAALKKLQRQLEYANVIESETASLTHAKGISSSKKNTSKMNRGV
jgi:hypothetical protein